MDLSPALRDMLRATRMPLYYTIAGLFVSIKSPQLFLNKKINRLIIPNEVVREQIFSYLLDAYSDNDLTYDDYDIRKSL